MLSIVRLLKIISGAVTASDVRQITLVGGTLVDNGAGRVTYTPPSGGVGIGSAVTNSVTQASHGFAVADVVTHNGSAYLKARADSAVNAEVFGIVSAVVDADTFTLTSSGYITGLSGLTAGSTYFLSEATAGLLTATEPASVGQVSKPLLLADTATSGYLENFRGAVVSNASGSLTVTEVDGSPSVAASTLRFDNGTVTDAGGGVARISGLQGPAGATGATGATGDTGADGAAGAAGATGATGATGDTGADGAAGAAGDAGPNVVSGSTTTALTGLLTGNGANVGSLPLNTYDSAGTAAAAVALLAGVWRHRPDGSTTRYPASADTDAARGTALATAKAAAVSGDLITVGPGGYTISASLAKNGVNWHFAAGASVTFADDVSTVGIWDDGGTAMTFTVSGDGDFTRSTADEFLAFHLVNCTNAASNMLIRGRDFTAAGADGECSTFWCEAGVLNFDARNISGTGPSSYGVWWANGTMRGRAYYCYGGYVSVGGAVNATPTGDAYFTAEEIVGLVGSFGTDTTAAYWIETKVLRQESGATVAISTAGGMRFYLSAQKIFGQAILNGGLVYIAADKWAALANGGTTNGNFIKMVAGTTADVRVNVTHFDPGAFTGEAFTVNAAGGTLRIEGGELIAGTGGKGLIQTAGTVLLREFRLNTSATSGTNAIQKNGGTLTLQDCYVTAHSASNSVGAATAQTVTLHGASTFGRPVDGNTTLSGGTYGVNSGDQDLSSYITSVAVAAGYQPLDSDLTAIAALATTANGRALLTSANALTIAATASISGTNTGDVANTALTTGTLAQFAATTSSQLAGVISDETGTGSLVFGTSPTLSGPTISGGTVTGMTTFSLLDQSGAGAFKVKIEFDQNETAARTLSLRLGASDRRLVLTGNPSLSAITTTGTGTIATGTFTLTVGATASISGTNTGDQVTFDGGSA